MLRYFKIHKLKQLQFMPRMNLHQRFTKPNEVEKKKNPVLSIHSRYLTQDISYKRENNYLRAETPTRHLH